MVFGSDLSFLGDFGGFFIRISCDYFYYRQWKNRYRSKIFSKQWRFQALEITLGMATCGMASC